MLSTFQGICSVIYNGRFCLADRHYKYFKRKNPTHKTGYVQQQWQCVLQRSRLHTSSKSIFVILHSSLILFLSGLFSQWPKLYSVEWHDD